jgi:hypothetical protein
MKNFSQQTPVLSQSNGHAASFTMTHKVYLALVAIIIGQSITLWNGCEYSSPTPDEAAHLLAGIEYWQTGKTSLYNVNPPLTKIWSTLPCVLRDRFVIPRPETGGWRDPSARQEFELGMLFAEQQPEFEELLKSSRRMCACYAVLGTLGVFYLASSLLSGNLGLIAAVLWAFLPLTLGHGALLSADIPAAAMGCWMVVAARGAFARPTLRAWSTTGVLIGLSILTKFTWLIVLPLWPLVVLLHEYYGSSNRSTVQNLCKKLSIRILLVWFIAWAIICTGYRWQGVLTPLGDYKFVSALMRGDTDNRFNQGWLKTIPSVLPENMIRGLDQQWQDFDEPRLAYLNGEWKIGGWWDYYLWALAYKLPIGLLVLIAVGTFISCGNRALLVATLFPTIALMTLISSKMNMNEHVRYVWVVVPFLCVLAASAFRVRNMILRISASFCMLWCTASGLWSFPCGVAHMNELAGLLNRECPLAGSANDWSNDWYSIREWLRHSKAESIALHGTYPVSLRVSGIKTEPDPPRSIEEQLDANTNVQVTLVMTVNTRMSLQRKLGFPSPMQQRNAEKRFCCTEVYSLPIDQVVRIPGIVWYANAKNEK